MGNIYGRAMVTNNSLNEDDVVQQWSADGSETLPMESHRKDTDVDEAYNTNNATSLKANADLDAKHQNLCAEKNDLNSDLVMESKNIAQQLNIVDEQTVDLGITGKELKDKTNGQKMEEILTRLISIHVPKDKHLPLKVERFDDISVAETEVNNIDKVYIEVNISKLSHNAEFCVNETNAPSESKYIKSDFVESDGNDAFKSAKKVEGETKKIIISEQEPAIEETSLNSKENEQMDMIERREVHNEALNTTCTVALDTPTEAEQENSHVADKEEIFNNVTEPISIDMVKEKCNEKERDISNKNLEMVKTEFLWEDGGADVQIMGSFNDWKTKMNMNKMGNAFGISIDLVPGEYSYKYIVDGEWKLNKNQPIKKDKSGFENNVIVIVKK